MLALPACGVKGRTHKTRENIEFFRSLNRLSIAGFRACRIAQCEPAVRVPNRQRSRAKLLNFVKQLLVFTFCLLCLAAHAQTDTVGKDARVVIVEDSRATHAFEPDPAIVRKMVERGIVRLTGKTNSALAWQSLVTIKDVIGIKVFSTPGPNSGTRPAVVGAVIEELLNAGIKPTNIVIWDKHLYDLRLAGFDALAQKYNVRIAGAADAGFDPNVYVDKPIIGNLVWGDLEFGKEGPTIGRKSFLTKLLTHDITKIINIPPLLNHNMAGVCGNLYSLAMGSIDNSIRFESTPDRLFTAVPDIYNLTNLFDRVAINITDALVGQYKGEQETKLHYAVELNQIWFSKDAVALDVLALRELEREREVNGANPPPSAMELYQNASWVELGISDPKRIHVEMFKANAQ